MLHFHWCSLTCVVELEGALVVNRLGIVAKKYVLSFENGTGGVCPSVCVSTFALSLSLSRVIQILHCRMQDIQLYQTNFSYLINPSTIGYRYIPCTIIIEMQTLKIACAISSGI